MNSRRMSELHRYTYYPLIIRFLSAEGTNSSIYKEGKVLQGMQKTEASHRARRGHRTDEQCGKSESASSKCPKGRAPADCGRVSMWFLPCQIIDKKSSIFGSLSVLTTDSIANLFFAVIFNTLMAIILHTKFCVQSCRTGNTKSTGRNEKEDIYQI